MSDDEAERLLDARIFLGSYVKIHREGWQERYCEGIKRIARYFAVSDADLSKSFMEHYGPCLFGPGIFQKIAEEDVT